MFDIAWSEFLIVAVVALVVVGPRDLPALLRNVGRMIGTVRRMAGEFQTQFNDALKEAELDELRREVSGLKDVASKAAGGDPFSIARDELKTAIDGKPAATPSALSGETPPQQPESAGPVPSALVPEPPARPANDLAAVVNPKRIPKAEPEPAMEAPAEAPPPPSDVEAAEPTPKSGAAS